MTLPPFIETGGVRGEPRFPSKEKIDHLSKKKRIKKSATVALDLKQFRFSSK